MSSEIAKQYLKEADTAFNAGKYNDARKAYQSAGTSADTTRAIWRKGLEGIARCEAKLGLDWHKRQPQNGTGKLVNDEYKIES